MLDKNAFNTESKIFNLIKDIDQNDFYKRKAILLIVLKNKNRSK